MIDPAAADTAVHAASPVAALLPGVVILAAGLISLLVTRLTRISSIVGFIVAGVILGDQGGLGVLSHSSSTVHLLAELGVVFLLFDIGLHFSVRELKENRRDLLGLAPLQMLIASVAFTGILLFLNAPWPLAIIVGTGFGLSSTAVVARLLAEQHLSTCPLGRSALSVLVFQDVVAIFLLIFAGSLSSDPSNIAVLAGLAFAKAIMAFAAALVLGRFVAKPAFAMLAKLQVEETFPITVLLIILAAAAASAAAGLSLTLGAFLAGMIVAHSPYRPLVQTEVRPFRALLLSFFFMTVGIALNIEQLLSYLPYVLLVAIGVLVIKTVLIGVAALLTGWSPAGALRLGALMAQASEFALVILGISAVATGFGDGPLVSVLIAGAALSIAIAPGWSWLGKRAATLISERFRPATELSKLPSAPGGSVGDEPVVVIGLTEPGRLAIDALRAHAIAYVALETDPALLAEADAMGYSAALGDTADVRFWEAAGAARPRAVVLGLSRYEVSKALTPIIRDKFPHVVRFVAVDNVGEFVRHNRLGMRAHLMDAEPHGLELAVDVLRHCEVSEEDIQAWIADIRSVQADAGEPPTTAEAA